MRYCEHNEIRSLCSFVMAQWLTQWLTYMLCSFICGLSSIHKLRINKFLFVAKSWVSLDWENCLISHEPIVWMLIQS